MGDGDTGFGNALNIIRTLQDFIQVGAAGFNIEDQVFRKRCGHMEGKQIMSEEEMVLKTEAAVEAREKLDPDFVINSRADAIAISGCEDAIKGATAYAKAGAVKRINAPVSINLLGSVVGGKTPLIPIGELKALGVTRISVPVGTVFIVVKALREYLSVLKERGIMPDSTDLLCTFAEFKKVDGLPEYTEFAEHLKTPELFSGVFYFYWIFSIICDIFGLALLSFVSFFKQRGDGISKFLYVSSLFVFKINF